jgi:hypothetical protein
MFAFPLILRFLGSYWKPLLVVGFLVAAVTYHKLSVHRAYAAGRVEGVALTRAEDKAAADALLAQANRNLALAEARNASTQKTLDDYRASHPLSYRLCVPDHEGGPGVSEGSGDASHGDPSGGSGPVQGVPPTGAAGPADRGPLLEALVAIYAQTAAGLSEWQAVGNP